MLPDLDWRSLGCRIAPHVHCCWSCHEDEEWGYEMSWIDLPGGIELPVCCAVSNWWSEEVEVQ